MSVVGMAGNAAHRAGTGSSHNDPIAIVSSPQASGEDAEEFPDIDNLLPIDLTSNECVPSYLLQSSVANDGDHPLHPDWNGIESEDDDEALGATIPDPPEGFQSATIDDLQNAVNTWAKDHGFAVVRKNGRNREKRGENKGEYTRYELFCDRNGIPQSRSTGLRRSASRKCSCNWKGYAVRSSEGWLYRNYSEGLHHNHPASSHPSAHPQHRKRNKEVLKTIAKAAGHPGIRAREVGSIVADQHPETSLTDKDIYNTRAILRREELGGRSPTGALIALLDEEKIPYKVKWEDDRKEMLVGLVFTFPDLMEMTARNWEVVSADMTYKTNVFNYPLFQVTGMTACNTIYNSFFGVIDNEKRGAFDWLCTAMKELREEHKIKEPLVFITDQCKEMKGALSEIFPNTQQQLCIFHVIKNVLANAKKKFNKKVEIDSDDEEGDDDALSAEELAALARLRIQARDEIPGTARLIPVEIPHNHHGVEALFKAMVYARTEDDFFKASSVLKTEFADQPAILRYIQKIWMPSREQWATCYTKNYKNFGARVTSPTEASNFNIKSYLLNAKATSYRLFQAVDALVKRQLKVYKETLAREAVRTKFEYLNRPFLFDLARKVSYRALDLINEEYKIAQASQPAPNREVRPLKPCYECTAPLQFGIPCRHKILSLMLEKRTPQLWDLNPHWHLKTPLVSSYYLDCMASLTEIGS
jgi:hypothetical protein